MRGLTYLKEPSPFFVVMRSPQAWSPLPGVHDSKNLIPEKMSVPFW
jgi:hypothetical protein